MFRAGECGTLDISIQCKIRLDWRVALLLAVYRETERDREREGEKDGERQRGGGEIKTDR